MSNAPYTEEMLLAGAKAIFDADIGSPDWHDKHFQGFKDDCFRYARLVLDAALLLQQRGCGDA